MASPEVDEDYHQNYRDVTLSFTTTPTADWFLLCDAAVRELFPYKSNTLTGPVLASSLVDDVGNRVGKVAGVVHHGQFTFTFRARMGSRGRET
jgi:hypothetical protein